jgi:hypothetical protein
MLQREVLEDFYERYDRGGHNLLKLFEMIRNQRRGFRIQRIQLVQHLHIF